jgi:large subunit ribosomal protein L22
MIATLDNYSQSPRKVRLVTELVKGKSVSEALKALEFLPKKASEPIAKLLKSAIANAKEAGKDTEALKVKGITVESAGMAKRYMPRAMGRATIIRRKKSRVKLVLA